MPNGNLYLARKNQVLTLLRKGYLGAGHPMTKELQELLAAAKRIVMSSEQKEEQRRSFVYGNTNIENSLITRETVNREAEAIKSK